MKTFRWHVELEAHTDSPDHPEISSAAYGESVFVDAQSEEHAIALVKHQARLKGVNENWFYTREVAWPCLP